jgi:type I restriction enzyme M protein
VKDDEYVPHGKDIEAFLAQEISQPVVRWEDSPQLGYEVLPTKYFYRCPQSTSTSELLAQFWTLEKEAENLLKGLAIP